MDSLFQSCFHNEMIFQPRWCYPFFAKSHCLTFVCCVLIEIFSVKLQSDTRKAEDEMKLYYVCTNVHCSHRWTDIWDVFTAIQTAQLCENKKISSRVKDGQMILWCNDISYNSQCWNQCNMICNKKYMIFNFSKVFNITYILSIVKFWFSRQG